MNSIDYMINFLTKVDNIGTDKPYYVKYFSWNFIIHCDSNDKCENIEIVGKFVNSVFILLKIFYTACLSKW